MFRRAILSAALTLAAATAGAGETAQSTTGTAALAVAFHEGAPKDRFVFRNAGSCDLEGMDITLDLSTSASGIIFDVTGTGAGVEVFQPFEIISGKAFVASQPSVGDGDTRLTLRLNSLPAGKEVAFTIDVDDTGGTREITVSDSEMRGATASVQTASWAASEAFLQTADLNLALPACS